MTFFKNSLKSTLKGGILFFLPFHGFAQECDNMILSDGEEISCIVQEIGIDNVSYKKCDFIDGPLYIIEKKDVFLIKYKNGEKEIFQKSNVEHSIEESAQPKSSEPFQTYFDIDSIPIDGKCLTFYMKNRKFQAEILKFKLVSIYYFECGSPERIKNDILKSSVSKIEDENGNVIYTIEL